MRLCATLCKQDAFLQCFPTVQGQYAVLRGHGHSGKESLSLAWVKFFPTLALVFLFVPWEHIFMFRTCSHVLNMLLLFLHVLVS